MQTSTASILAYGKLPVHGDFVRYNAGGRALRALDEWIQQGLYYAKSRLGRGYDEAYDSMQPVRFLYAAPDAGAAIIGVMRPSRDRSRRTFPFLIAAEIDAGSSHPGPVHQAPVRYEGFLDCAERLTADGVSGKVDHREMSEWIEASRLGAVAAHGTAAMYDRFLEETTVAAWCAQLWGTPDDPRKYLLFKNLLEVMKPFGEHHSPTFTFGLQFPTAEGLPGEAAAVFWMDLCAHILRQHGLNPVCFWHRRPEGDGRGRFILFFRMPPARAMVSLLSDDPPDDDVYDLGTTTGGEADASVSLPARLRTLLEDEGTSLSALLSGV